jgi:malto-oligosyltrehalose trehalohydrolase
MSISPSVILITEPLLISDAALIPEQQTLLSRLLKYCQMDFVSVVLVSQDRPNQIRDTLGSDLLPKHCAVFSPVTGTINVLTGDYFNNDQLEPKTTPQELKSWITQNHVSSTRSVLFVSSAATVPFARSFYSIVSPQLGTTERQTLARSCSNEGLQSQLFFADSDGIQGVFQGLHWFDALPAGASENTPSTDVKLGTTSIKRDVTRVAVESWASSVDVVVNRNGWNRTISIPRMDGRRFVADIDHFSAGDRYAFALNGNFDKLYPDPRSRRQPEGVHGWSEHTGPNVFPWQDKNWNGIRKQDLVIYELHIGTFTVDGTFLSTIERIPELIDLGITAIELLPIVECAGRWNWGYDGVNLFAPYHQYGSPDELKQLINHCHQAGLAVILDVVYNHPGPEGNYLAEFGPYFSKQHQTPWGPAYNYDGYNRDLCREWVLDNVIYWLEEFHFDGLRLDAIHFMFDNSEPSIIRDVSTKVRELESRTNKPYLLIGETNVYDRSMTQPASEGGMGFDAIWCDDMMHSIYSIGSPETRLTDRTYHAEDLAEVLSHGFIYQGPPTERVIRDGETLQPKHTIPSSVVALQTHDSVGNQPQGKRLHHLTNADFHRAAATFSLLYPAIPMLFMGDESLEPNPFHYFVDFHDPWLRDAIAKSRRHEHPQQDWDRTISPLNDTAFFESKITSGTTARLNEDQKRTRNWYKQLIAIRKEWASQRLLHVDSMEVSYLKDPQLFQLVYRQNEMTGSVAIRLSNPDTTASGSVNLKVHGRVLADSLNTRGQTFNELETNHAVVVEGEIEVV